MYTPQSESKLHNWRESFHKKKKNNLVRLLIYGILGYTNFLDKPITHICPIFSCFGPTGLWVLLHPNTTSNHRALSLQPPSEIQAVHAIGLPILVSLRTTSSLHFITFPFCVIQHDWEIPCQNRNGGFNRKSICKQGISLVNGGSLGCCLKIIPHRPQNQRPHTTTGLRWILEVVLVLPSHHGHLLHCPLTVTDIHSASPTVQSPKLKCQLHACSA